MRQAVTKRKAVVVGSRGQDGRLLAAALRRDGWKVTGIARRGPVDILSRGQVERLIARLAPDHVYYLAAHHHSSQDAPEDGRALFRRSWAVHVDGLVHFLEAIRKRSPRTRLFYASSSLVFGAPKGGRASEKTRLAPRDAYGLSKAAGMLTCRLYRRRYGLFAAVGILFNHESPLRDKRFLSRKLARGAVAVRFGKARELVLGDLDARADWGWAPDAVDAMRRILALPAPDDFVVATGRAHSVREFARAAFGHLGLDWRRYVRAAPGVLTRRKPALAGDAAKLRRATGWKPTVSFEDMAARLVDAELRALGE